MPTIMSAVRAPAACRRAHWTGYAHSALTIALVAACGASANHGSSNATRSTPGASATTTSMAAATGNTDITVPQPTTTTPAVATTMTTAAAPTFAAVTGSYVAGTADGGWLYLRSDGASRFRGPDDVACPACGTANSPIAVLDLSLTSISATGPGAYHASGTIAGISDPTWARQLSSSATAGSHISLSIAAGGHLSLSILPANDVLTFSSQQAPPSSATACTVAAVMGPVLAGVPGNPHVNGVTCSVEGEWAAASVTVGGQGGGSIDEVVVLAGNGGAWTVVDRPTICSHHDVTPSFFNAACGTA